MEDVFGKQFNNNLNQILSSDSSNDGIDFLASEDLDNSNESNSDCDSESENEVYLN